MTPADPDALIHLRVPAALKARWVRASQREGLKLTDWVVRAVDRPANKLAQAPCPRCGSVLLAADGPGHWQCAQCGLVS